jgi:hypothetical protein
MARQILAGLGEGWAKTALAVHGTDLCFANYIIALVCVRCGQRAESRAKTNAELAMSHSATDEARAWDFGMIDSDLIGFPICQAVEEQYWSAGRLNNGSSYWHERNWVRWRLVVATGLVYMPPTGETVKSSWRKPPISPTPLSR